MDHKLFRIDANWIIPVLPERVVWKNHCLIIENGRIAEILPSNLADSKYPNLKREEFPRHAILPGFVNAHTHAAMNLLRGYSDDLPLMTWLQEHIWPAEERWLSDEFVYDGTKLAIAEMLRSGTTCFNDMYMYSDSVAAAANDCQMRAMVGVSFFSFATSWGRNGAEYLEKAAHLCEKYQHHELIKIAIAPHAPYTVNDADLDAAKKLAEQYQIHRIMHLHETATEVNDSITQYGMRPIQRLQERGYLSADFCAVHMTQLNDAEIALLAKTKVNVIHCPESNLKLASGFCPIDKLLHAGVNVALGTDGAASNNDLDMLHELRIAALLAKGISGNPTAVPAHQALAMATINGARALGLDSEIGSLEVGKAADFIAIDLGEIESLPLYEPISQIVYATGREQVSDVWIKGQRLLNNRKFTQLNYQDLRALAQKWQTRILSSSQKPVTIE